MKHLDLFSGIGGFAYAIDQVWDNADHIFVEKDKFCQLVLKKHWPEAMIHGDIKTFTNTDRAGTSSSGIDRDRQKENEGWNEQPQSESCGQNSVTADTESARTGENESGIRSVFNGHSNREQVFILTGGFPCQPFSQAGKRKGTADDRHLWPEMLRVIREFHPTWVIAENVRGILSIEGGMVFEQVCLDLENEGYEVQPFVIPACAVNAPHRRDRVWIVANSKSRGQWMCEPEGHRQREQEEATGDEYRNDTSDSKRSDWTEDWLSVATRTCVRGVDDGVSAGMDFAGYTKAGHRVQRLKALGNSIVPHVAIEILKAIKINT